MNAVTSLAVAVLVGGTFAAGVLCVLSALPRWRAASLTVRIAPYVRDVVADERMPAGLLPHAGMLPARERTSWHRARRTLERLAGGGEALRQKLSQAGLAIDPVIFRGRQLGWALAGVGAGALLMIVLALLGRLSALAVAVPLLAGVAAAVGYDSQLSARARARRSRLTE